MAMNVGSSNSGDPEVMADINTTPLIDVMLVLLIMLIITIPIQLHSVDLNLPAGASQPPSAPPEVVRVDIDAGGIVRWNGEALAGDGALEAKLSAAAVQAVQPELHIRPDRQVEYKVVARVMAAVQRLGLTKIGVVGNEQFL
ncbi:biopolymer transporter ExbD [Herbaspirillum sp. HC18]|nr:biopolymer transporter ExbD [Herbaspirillum sp. HC18]